MTAPAAPPAAAKRPWRHRVGIAVLLVAAALFVRACVRGTVTSPERTTAEGLEPGRVESRLVLRDGRRWVQLSALIDAPIAQVWRVVHDHERMTEFMPRMAKLSVLSEQGDAHRRVRIDFSFLVIDRFTEIDVTREVTPELRVETWNRVGGSLPTNQGRWLLQPEGAARTFARYEVDAQTGLPAPHWLELALLRDALPVVLRDVKKRIDLLRATEPAYLDEAK